MILRSAVACQDCGAAIPTQDPLDVAITTAVAGGVAVGRCEACAARAMIDAEGGLLKAARALLAEERHTADNYCESEPTCIWCLRGAPWGKGAESIEHRGGCVWEAFVAQVEDAE